MDKSLAEAAAKFVDAVHRLYPGITQQRDALLTQQRDALLKYNCEGKGRGIVRANKLEIESNQ